MEAKETFNTKDTQNLLISLINKMFLWNCIFTLIIISLLAYCIFHLSQGVPVEHVKMTESSAGEVSWIKALLEWVAHAIVWGCGKFMHSLKISWASKGIKHLLNMKALVDHAKYGMILGLFSESFTQGVTFLWKLISGS
jgi:hypothetical protein